MQAAWRMLTTCSVEDQYRPWKSLVNCVKSKYKCTAGWLSNPGDEVYFLKRRYLLVTGELMIIVNRTTSMTCATTG